MLSVQLVAQQLFLPYYFYCGGAAFRTVLCGGAAFRTVLFCFPYKHEIVHF